FFLYDTATPPTYTLSLHDALPICEEILAMITDYEGKSVDAYYDNLGTANHAPHVVNGYPYDHGQPYVPTMLSENNRPSQRSMHLDRKSTRLNSSHVKISYAVFCLK